MKFGKGLMGEILASSPEWAPFWLNYKNLKKRIKAVAKAPNNQGANATRDISECELEVAFFKDLQTELKKISVFYASEEKRFVFRYQQLRSVWKDLKKRDRIDAFEAQRLMFALVHFYRECIRLENFAVMNYQGFSKILKKHDKMTGYNTRTKYMRRKVNLSQFSNYPILLQVLESTEEMFHEVDKDARMTGVVSKINMKISVDTTHQTGISPTGPHLSLSTPLSVASTASLASVNTPPMMMYAPMTPSMTSRPLPSPLSSLPTVPTPTARSFPNSVLWRPDDEDRTTQV